MEYFNTKEDMIQWFRNSAGFSAYSDIELNQIWEFEKTEFGWTYRQKK